MKITFLKSYILVSILFFSLISAIPIKIENSYIHKDKVSLESIAAKDVLKLTSNQIELISGVKQSFKSKIVLRLIKRDIKSEIKKGNLEPDFLLNFNDLYAEELFVFDIGGFLLGFFLGLIGVGLAHIFSDDKNFRKSSWKGWGASLIILLLLLLL